MGTLNQKGQKGTTQEPSYLKVPECGHTRTQLPKRLCSSEAPQTLGRALLDIHGRPLNARQQRNRLGMRRHDLHSSELSVLLPSLRLQSVIVSSQCKGNKTRNATFTVRAEPTQKHV